MLYAKKSKLNDKLLQLHLKCADDWNNVWPIIIKSIEDKLTNEMESHYNNLNKKLDKLQEEKPNKGEKVQPRNQQFHYHNRTVNLTNIKFTQEEMNLLNNGLQYSIETPTSFKYS